MPNPKPAVPAPLLAPLRVMLVDDSPMNLETMTDFLQIHAFEVLAIGHPFGALRQAPGFNADVYVLDIGLPGMEGYQLVKQLRQLDTHYARLIALTGYGQRTDKERARAAGFDVHFTKPVDPQVLLQTLYAAAAKTAMGQY
jgi:CheY-like chemotaxis protein